MLEDKIYLSKSGYNQYLEEINKLKEKLNQNNLSKRQAYEEAPGDGWHDNFVFEDIVRQEDNLLTQIENIIKKNKDIVVIERKNNDNLVDIDDIVELELLYDDGSSEIDKFLLTANYKTNHFSDIDEISINSPLGRCIYQKKIGATNKYEVNGMIIKVNIIRKIN